ncbi:MAG: Rieske 2Fe-2S domain-containing protein [Terracidiphilus sp.]|jgi:Rieske Fe-S protein
MNPNEPDPQPIPQGDQSSEQPVETEPNRGKQAAHSRRAFLFKLSLLANGVVGAVLAVPIVGYLLGPALRKKSSEESWIGLGPVSLFPEGETRLVTFRNPVTTAWDGQTGDVPCWVRRVSGTTFQVFAINCAHLGCPVRWFSESKLFLCPCHGGAYYEDGSRASGPPERGLFEYEHRIAGDALEISAGKMPTLAACGPSPRTLTQIAGVGTGTWAAGAEKPEAQSLKPRCGSCQG